MKNISSSLEEIKKHYKNLISDYFFFCHSFNLSSRLPKESRPGTAAQLLAMGITGLLQFIKDAAEPINVKKYKGQTVAVDTYCWLHKGAFSCAEKLAKGEPTEQ